MACTEAAPFSRARLAPTSVPPAVSMPAKTSALALGHICRHDLLPWGRRPAFLWERAMPVNGLHRGRAFSARTARSYEVCFRVNSAFMNRTLYTVLFHLGMPLVFLRLLWRARRAPAYSKRIGERFAIGLPPLKPGGIWVHAVSVGESIAAAPMIRE